MKKIVGILGLFVALPIWYYILYQILSAVNASELTWFLYWVYIPVCVLLGILKELAGDL